MEGIERLINYKFYNASLSVITRRNNFFKFLFGTVHNSMNRKKKYKLREITETKEV